MLLVLLYSELNFSVLIGRKRKVNFQNQRLWRHLASDYTIIMSRTDNRVIYGRGAWFLRAIMSSSPSLCCSPKKQKYDYHFLFVHCIITQSVISSIIKVLVRVPWVPGSFVFSFATHNSSHATKETLWFQGYGDGNQPQLSASANNPYFDLGYSRYHKTLV